MPGPMRLGRDRKLEIEFGDDEIRKLGENVARQTAVQDLYDRVLSMGQGKPVEEVKAILAREWRAALGGDITDPELSHTAGLLAHGHRIKVPS
jgi:hypothetical protein